jgi:hypothetical protein
MQHKWGKRNADRLLVGKPEGKRPLGGRRHGSMSNIKMDFYLSDDTLV